MELSIEELTEVASIIQRYIILCEETKQSLKNDKAKEFYYKKKHRAEQLRDKLMKIHAEKLIKTWE